MVGVEERDNFRNRQYYYNDSIELITVPKIPEKCQNDVLKFALPTETKKKSLQQLVH